MNFILRWISVAVAVAAAVAVVPGITVIGGQEAWVPFVVVALILALINVSIKPILKVLSLPVTVLTLGLFALVINAAMLELASSLAVSLSGSGLRIGSFGSALAASIIVSIVSSIVNRLVGVED